VTSTRAEPPPFDPEAVRAKYRAERDKRLVPGRADIRDLRKDAFFAAFRNDPFTPVAPRDPVSDDVDVVIIGAGIAGLVAGAQLREVGVERIRLIDEAGGIGGTWYWNQYPGVMCDVEATIYMPMLEELDYVPTTRYAFGAEILQHLEAIARKYNLTDDALLHTSVERSAWDDALGRWVIRTNRGDEVRARYLVLAVGILNLMKLPAIPGMETFAGRSFHTARWDFEYTGGGPDGGLTKLHDKTVAVVGTGASGIQCIPHLAASAEKVYVFQRTPSAIGERGNRPTDESVRRETRRPGWQRERMMNFQDTIDGRPVDVDLIADGWTLHFGPTRNPRGTEGLTPKEVARVVEKVDLEVMDWHRRRIDEIVVDPAKADALKPYYRYICKRPCFHDEYLPAFNAPNVTLVDCPAGIERVDETGLVVDGEHYDVDCIVYATGFEAETTPLSRRVGHDIVGRRGITLADKWEAGASTLFGIMTRGFPNLFVMPAPGQQAVITVNNTLINVVVADHIAATVAELEKQHVTVFEVTEDAEAEWRETIVGAFVDASATLSACTPSRLNFEGDLTKYKAENGSYGGRAGDFHGYVALIDDWLGRLQREEPVGLTLEHGVG